VVIGSFGGVRVRRLASGWQIWTRREEGYGDAATLFQRHYTAQSVAMASKNLCRRRATVGSSLALRHAGTDTAKELTKLHNVAMPASVAAGLDAGASTFAEGHFGQKSPALHRAEKTL
jgi:hypothetical protein